MKVSFDECTDFVVNVTPTPLPRRGARRLQESLLEGAKK